MAILAFAFLVVVERPDEFPGSGFRIGSGLFCRGERQGLAFAIGGAQVEFALAMSLVDLDQKRRPARLDTDFRLLLFRRGGAMDMMGDDLFAADP